jgi:type III restriction enzyme
MAMDIDNALIEDISARLDLRRPNREALEHIALVMARYYDEQKKAPPFEAVIDSATGVGKTYILAAAIEYFAAAYGVRDFAVIAPGTTIRDKTVNNFTKGHPKSLVRGMDIEPVVVTSENFTSAAMRAEMDNADQTKLYIFTVQALTKPSTNVGKKTHKFQESLGEGFYTHLKESEHLVVFADEHHCYYGDAFSAAVRELDPWVLLGLTATPHPKTAEEDIIYRYPLAAAIAERLVKTPVIVGRKDDRNDAETKLRDGLLLLDLKRQTIETHQQVLRGQKIKPVMLVIAQTTTDANEFGKILRDPSFGLDHEEILVVHSDAKHKEQALAELDRVEESTNPVRVIVSVGMLKEGWDVKNVYVIASMRASVSKILTEQTLGRGLRLPFDTYTGIEFLDTLEVIAHERFEQLLKRKDVINQAFIDEQTRAVVKKTMGGDDVVSITKEPVVTDVEVDGAGGTGEPQVKDLEAVTEAAKAQAALKAELYPRNGAPKIQIPRRVLQKVKSDFSLAEITNKKPFRELGEKLAANPDDELRRTQISAKLIENRDGTRETVLVTQETVDEVVSEPTLIDLQDARGELVDRVFAAGVVPARAPERKMLARLIDTFLKGLGDDAEELLSRYLGRASARFIELLTDEQRKWAAKPSAKRTIELEDFHVIRTARTKTSRDRQGKFQKGVGYKGYKKSAFIQEWFDSEPERAVANMLDSAKEVSGWLRLQIGDMPILFRSSGTEYNPDFIAVEGQDTYWVIEVKADAQMANEVVQEKRQAAQRWAQHVTASSKVKEEWRYLLVSESDIKDAKDNWSALKNLGDHED